MNKVNSYFNDEKSRTLIGKCHKCGELIYHVILSNGDEYDTENCRCKELERDRQNVLNMMNNKNFIIAQNKAKCGFSKRDLEELRLPIKTHQGNIKAYNLIIKYANEFNRNISMGLFIHGSPGVGKSLFSKRIMLIILNKGFSTYITSVTKLMRDIKKDVSSFADDTYRKCLDIDLLVIDDIGTEKPTDYDKTQMFEIINNRYENKKPIIYTSNCKLEDLTTKYDEFGRIYSRILGSVVQVEIKGNDFRQQKQFISNDTPIL